ncbi:MAG: hypothetical protein GY696_13240, partial [Gammaproteobacteria bacterium]|nr:hypothetical protein [Gammaproteobacteria bacterium]
DDKCQTAFGALMRAIASPKVLTPFNPNLQTRLMTDASDVGLGAVLSQLQDGNYRPIAFTSKPLSTTERNYSTPERKALACVWGTYLAGISSFTLIKDPSSHCSKDLVKIEHPDESPDSMTAFVISTTLSNT